MDQRIKIIKNKLLHAAAKKWCFLTKDFTSEIKKLFHWAVCQKLKMCKAWLLLLCTTFLKAKINPLEFEKSIAVAHQWPSDTLLAFYLILDNPLPALSNRTFHAMTLTVEDLRAMRKWLRFQKEMGWIDLGYTVMRPIWAQSWRSWLTERRWNAAGTRGLGHVPEYPGIWGRVNLQGAQLAAKCGWAQTQTQ